MTRILIAILFITSTLLFADWSGPVNFSDKYSTISCPSSKNIVVDDINGVSYVHTFVQKSDVGVPWPAAYGIVWKVGTLDRTSGVVTWLSTRSITGMDTNVFRCNPAVTVDSQHNLHLVWESTENRSDYGMVDNTELYYLKLTYTGVTPKIWRPGTPIRLTNKTMMYSGMADIDCDSSGYLHLVYMDSSADATTMKGFNTNIIYMKLNNQGQILPSYTQVLDNDTESYCDYPSVKVFTNTQGTFILTAWTEQNYIYGWPVYCYSQKYSRFYNPATSTWSIQYNLSSSNVHEVGFPRILTTKTDGEVNGYGVYFAKFINDGAPSSTIVLNRFSLNDGTWSRTELNQNTTPTTTAVDCVIEQNGSGNYECIYSNHRAVYPISYDNLIHISYDNSFQELSRETISTQNNNIPYSMHNLIIDNQDWLHVMVSGHNSNAQILFNQYENPIDQIWYFNYQPDKNDTDNTKKLNKKQAIKKDLAKLSNLKFSSKQKEAIKKALASGSRKSIGKSIFANKNSRKFANKNPQAAKEALSLVKRIKLYPNPMKNQINLEFSLDNQQTVDINIYDVSGKLIRKVARSSFAPGASNLSVDLSDQPKGIYICTFECAGVKTRKTILVE